MVPYCRSFRKTAKSKSGTALFFVVHPEMSNDKLVAEKPRLTVQFLRDGKEVSRSTLDTGSPDEVHSLEILVSGGLPPGDYVARITVEQGGCASQESAALRVNQ